MAALTRRLSDLPKVTQWSKARIQDVLSLVPCAFHPTLRLKMMDWLEQKVKENRHVSLKGFKLIRTWDGKKGQTAKVFFRK